MKTIKLPVSFKETNPFVSDTTGNTPNKPETPKVEPNNTETKEEEVVGLPVSLLKQFMSVVEKLSNDNNASKIDANLIASSIKDAIGGRQKSSGVVNSIAYTKETLPIDDILEKPVMFFALCAATVIYDDVVKGMTVSIPYNPVKFVPFLRYENPSQKGKMITQCMALVWSKSQVEFIRNHSLFGIQYFERLDASTTYSNDLIDKVVAAYTRVSQYNDYQVKQKCIELNIKIDTNDFNTLKKRIAHKMAEELQKTEAAVRLSDVHDTEISKQIRDKESGLATKTYS